MLAWLQTAEHGLILFLVGFGLAYFFGGVVLGYRFWGKSRRADRACAPPLNEYAVFFLVPALDEAAVIADTVSRLAAHPEATVILVDDGSTDDTAELGRVAGGPRCLVLSRRLPDARLGKGSALNAAFVVVREEVARRGLDPAHTLICVMDADGHLSDDAVQRVEALFDDPEVGGVQLPVRIRNRRKVIERLQDLEFWALSALSQFARVAFGNVSLGGNGQFTRLSVLLTLDAEPWSPSLTEDLDLAVRITLGGHRLVSSPAAWVDQQAITSWSRLLRQRTRWMQGHMTCGRYMWKLLRSPNVSNPAAVETVLYLSVPWVLVLPWSILFHVTWTQTIISIVRYGLPIHATGVLPVAAYCVYLYLVSFLPMVVAGLIYRSRDGSVGWVRSVLIGHLLIAGFYVAMIAAWRAVFRMLRGTAGWDKTARVTELPALVPVGVDAELLAITGVVREPVLVGAAGMGSTRLMDGDRGDIVKVRTTSSASAAPSHTESTPDGERTDRQGDAGPTSESVAPGTALRKLRRRERRHAQRGGRHDTFDGVVLPVEPPWGRHLRSLDGPPDAPPEQSGAADSDEPSEGAVESSASVRPSVDVTETMTAQASAEPGDTVDETVSALPDTLQATQDVVPAADEGGNGQPSSRRRGRTAEQAGTEGAGSVSVHVERNAVDGPTLEHTESNSAELAEIIVRLENAERQVAIELERREQAEQLLTVAEQRANDVEQRAQRQVSDAERRAEQRVSDAEQRAEQRANDVEQRAEDRLSEAVQRIEQRVTAVEQLMQRRVAAVEQREESRVAAAESAAQQRVADAERAAQQRAADAERGAQQRAADVEKAMQQRIADLQQGIEGHLADAERRFSEAQAEADRRLAEARSDAERGLAAERAAAQQQLLQVQDERDAETERRTSAEERLAAAGHRVVQASAQARHRIAEVEQQLTELRTAAESAAQELLAERAEATRSMERAQWQLAAEVARREEAERRIAGTEQLAAEMTATALARASDAEHRVSVLQTESEAARPRPRPAPRQS